MKRKDDGVMIVGRFVKNPDGTEYLEPSAALIERMRLCEEWERTCTPEYYDGTPTVEDLLEGCGEPPLPRNRHAVRAELAHA